LATRYEHTHIIAGSGHGKTQLLLHQIVTEDLPAVERGERSVIVIDSQGDMLRDLLRLAELSPARRSLSERLVYIDPTDIEYPPCLNLFDFGLDRLSGYAPVERERLLNKVLASALLCVDYSGLLFQNCLILKSPLVWLVGSRSSSATYHQNNRTGFISRMPAPVALRIVGGSGRMAASRIY
jgi:hypothetical protein